MMVVLLKNFCYFCDPTKAGKTNCYIALNLQKYCLGKVPSMAMSFDRGLTHKMTYENAAAFVIDNVTSPVIMILDISKMTPIGL